MTNIPDYIDNVIESIDERIEEAEEILKFLKEQRVKALEFKTGTPLGRWYYYVRSRSGGDGHEVIRYPDTGKYSCYCPAGKAGTTCWAKRGIMENTDNTGRPNGLQGFYDETLCWYPFGASQKSWTDAKNQVR